MAGEVIILLFLACIFQAETQSCGYNQFYQGLKPSIQPEQIRPSTCPNQETIEFMPPPSNLIGLPNGFANRFPYETFGQNVLSDSVAISSAKASNIMPKTSSCNGENGLNLDAIRPILSPTEPTCLPTKLPNFASCPTRPQIGPTLPTASSVLDRLPTSIPKIESSYLSYPSKPLIPNLCNTPSSPTVIVNDGIANTLAESLQLYLLNDLIESSLQCPSVPSQVDFASSQASIANLSPGRVLNPDFINNQFNSYPPKSSINIAQSNSLASSNQIGSSSSATSISEVTTSNEPNLYTNYGYSRPTTSSISIAESSSSVVEPKRTFNPYLSGNYAGISPSTSSVSYTEVKTTAEPINSINPNNCGNVLYPKVPVIPERCPVNINPYRGFNNNVYGGSNNFGTSSFSFSEVISPSLPVIDEIRPLPQTLPCKTLPCITYYPTVNSVPATLCQYPEYIYPAAPLCLPNQYYPVQSNPTATSVSISESNPISQTAISISEVMEPSNTLSPASSSIAVAETSSSNSKAYAASEVTSSPVEEILPIIPLELQCSTNPLEIDSVATASTDETIPTLSSTEIVSSSFSQQLPTYQSPILLAVEIPSTIPSPGLSNGFYGGATGTACSCVPVTYELQIPSSIPAQLCCNLGFVDCTPVVCVNVEPVMC